MIKREFKIGDRVFLKKELNLYLIDQMILSIPKRITFIVHGDGQNEQFYALDAALCHISSDRLNKNNEIVHADDLDKYVVELRQTISEQLIELKLNSRI